MRGRFLLWNSRYSPFYSKVILARPAAIIDSLITKLDRVDLATLYII